MRGTIRIRVLFRRSVYTAGKGVTLPHTHGQHTSTARQVGGEEVERERAGDQIEERVENTRRPLRKESLCRSDGTPPLRCIYTGSHSTVRKALTLMSRAPPRRRQPGNEPGSAETVLVLGSVPPNVTAVRELHQIHSTEQSNPEGRQIGQSLAKFDAVRLNSRPGH